MKKTLGICLVLLCGCEQAAVEPARERPVSEPVREQVVAETVAEQSVVEQPPIEEAPEQPVLEKPVPEQETVEQQKRYEPDMVLVNGGTFRMGSPPDEAGRRDDEGPVHEVEVGDFYLGKCEVSFQQYDVFWKSTGREGPGHKGWGRGRRPVIFVSWIEAAAYCEWLSKETGKKYRLPTEAEWEYACRAGTSTQFSFGDAAADPGSYAWYRINSEKKTQEIGQLEPNPWGLYDMCSNVREWCADWYGSYPTEKQTNPTGPASGKSRVLRGGSWHDLPMDLRSARRSKGNPRGMDTDIGFRVAHDAH